ncbi:MAG: HAD-IIIA family hydrolase [Candidatus Omnitrophica bacterium]|nr:HAD-IIIA family hydrolase [Candidatus Omnitrophota bacterium]MCM8810311.1 HAD-IIIA family hydrolase [Candidatus Omnitrophota bacterium]
MKIVFLDRDGVISIFTPNDYIKKWEEFKFIPEGIDGLKILNDAGYKVIIISNQAGVNKGLFTINDLNEITENMLKELKNKGVNNILKVYYCIHTKEENCECRKPKTGLFKKAEQDFGKIEFSKTYFIGDADIDIIAGKNVGTNTILVLTGKTKSKKEIELWEAKPDYIFDNLKEAAEFIVKKGRENGKI